MFVPTGCLSKENNQNCLALICMLFKYYIQTSMFEDLKTKLYVLFLHTTVQTIVILVRKFILPAQRCHFGGLRKNV